MEFLTILKVYGLWKIAHLKFEFSQDYKLLEYTSIIITVDIYCNIKIPAEYRYFAIIPHPLD